MTDMRGRPIPEGGEGCPEICPTCLAIKFAASDAEAWDEARAEVERLTARVKELEDTRSLVADALIEAEWTEHGGGTRTCRGCHHSWSFPAEGHKPGCRVDAALKALGFPDEESRRRRGSELWQADQVKRYGRVMVGGRSDGT